MSVSVSGNTSHCVCLLVCLSLQHFSLSLFLATLVTVPVSVALAMSLTMCTMFTRCVSQAQLVQQSKKLSVEGAMTAERSHDMSAVRSLTDNEEKKIQEELNSKSQAVSDLQTQMDAAAGRELVESCVADCVADCVCCVVECVLSG